MSATFGRLAVCALAISGFALSGNSSYAQKKYDPGASDTEIKVGNTMPYSGPLSSYSVLGKSEAAYFNKINAEGGINGRKISFISYDDAASTPKTVEHTRKLVESDEVLLMFAPLGTPSNAAIQKYLNAKKVPQLFITSGATKWNNPSEFPWTMGWQPNYQSEGVIFAKYLLKEKPNAKVGLLFQNDDYGKDFVIGFKNGLGAKAASLIVAEEGYETSEPTIDSHIIKLKASGADTVFNASTPKFSAQAIRKIGELGWKPLHLLNSVSTSIGATLKPAGLEHAQGIVSTAYLKDPTDVQWKDDEGMKKFQDFVKKYYPEADPHDHFVVWGYTAAQTLVEVLRRCGDDSTRANVMKQAASIRGLALDGLLPGIVVETSATDFAPIEQLQLERFEGEHWNRFGDVISANAGG